MDSFDEKYNKLDLEYRSAVNAYRSGRQFMMTGINTSSAVMVDRLYPTIISSIVNEIFACELFLKSMLIIKTKHKIIKGHKLLELYNLLCDETIEKNMSKYDFVNELEKISNSFVEWRYCYEYDSMTINRGFVFDLCATLEKENRNIILEKFDLDMNQSFI